MLPTLAYLTVISDCTGEGFDGVKASPARMNQYLANLTSPWMCHQQLGLFRALIRYEEGRFSFGRGATTCEFHLPHPKARSFINICHYNQSLICKPLWSDHESNMRPYNQSIISHHNHHKCLSSMMSQPLSTAIKKLDLAIEREDVQSCT